VAAESNAGDHPPSPVLLVHGYASSFEHNWRQNGWVDLLTDVGREVVPVDLAGHGPGQHSHDPADYTDLEANVVAALPDSGTVDAVGFSLGARLLLGVASKMPERFGRIVVGGIAENAFQRTGSEALATALESGDKGAEGLPGLFVRFAEGSGNDPLALAAVMRGDTPPLTEEALGRITCPVLVVVGDKDFVGAPDRLVAALPNAKAKVLRNVDHFGTPKDFGFLDAALQFVGAV
jgi:pimeloyl-ACP methyl ester carboxylesterase